MIFLVYFLFLMKVKYFLFLLSLNFVKDNEIISIPLNAYNNLPKKTENENNSQEKLFIDELINSSLYSFMKIGDPESIAKVYISMENPYIVISSKFISKTEKDINYNYDIEKSITFKNISKTGKVYIKSVNDMIVKEKLKINILNNQNNNLEEIVVDDINLIFPIIKENNDTDKIKIYELIVGLKILIDNNNAFQKDKYSLIYQLLEKNIIKDSHWSIFYKKGNNKNGENLYNLNELINTKAELIFGDYPHNYKPYLLNENQLTTIKSKYAFWNLYFTSIYFYNSTNEKQFLDLPKAELSINEFYISGPMSYYRHINKHFFEKYIIENICHAEYSGKFLIIYCDKSIKFDVNNLQEFPTIYFEHDELNYTFELTYEDIFIEQDNKYWFLICFESYYEAENWILGSIFLRKYNFVFEQKTGTIGFYNMNTTQEEMKEEKPKRSIGIIIILFIIYSIVFIIIGFIVAKKYYKKKKKKVANELDEVYIKRNFDNANQKKKLNISLDIESDLIDANAINE